MRLILCLAVRSRRLLSSNSMCILYFTLAWVIFQKLIKVGSFREFHLGHPFLDETRMYRVLEKIYDSPTNYRASSRSLTKSEKTDLFQLNMVLAIGSVRLFRDGSLSLLPFGFFTAALEVNPPSESSFSTLEEVENILLIAWFGIYHNIGKVILF